LQLCNTERKLYGEGIGVGGVADVGAGVRVGGRDVAVGGIVGAVVAVGGASVGGGGTTSVAVALDGGVAVGTGELTSVGVQVGWRVGSAAENVAGGSGGLNGLNATRGFRKMIA